LVAAARHQLGLISERYAGNGLKSERAMLLKASRELQGLSENAGTAQSYMQQAQNWLGQFETGVAPRLKQKESKSLYNPDLLAAKLRP
jgi:hypothetical protein